MKLSQTSPDQPNLITSYQPGELWIGNIVHRGSLLFRPGLPPQPWVIEEISKLDQDSVAELLTYQPEIILFGTGKAQVFPPAQIFSALMQAGVGYEIMATDAACRTWNILLAEGRRVVAGLLV